MLGWFIQGSSILYPVVYLYHFYQGDTFVSCHPLSCSIVLYCCFFYCLWVMDVLYIHCMFPMCTYFIPLAYRVGELWHQDLWVTRTNQFTPPQTRPQNHSNNPKHGAHAHQATHSSHHSRKPPCWVQRCWVGCSEGQCRVQVQQTGRQQ